MLRILLVHPMFDTNMKKPFKFIQPGKLVDQELELVLVKTIPAEPDRGYVPWYEFEMLCPGIPESLGIISLRIGTAATLRYPGHIGYEVEERYRGHRYTARSCWLLLPLVAARGLKAVWLTVDPKNMPSRKTCEIIGAKYVETVPIPHTHEMYAQGARYRRRYNLNLKKIKIAKSFPVTIRQA